MHCTAQFLACIPSSSPMHIINQEDIMICLAFLSLVRKRKRIWINGWKAVIFKQKRLKSIGSNIEIPELNKYIFYTFSMCRFIQKSVEWKRNEWELFIVNIIYFFPLFLGFLTASLMMMQIRWHVSLVLCIFYSSIHLHRHWIVNCFFLFVSTSYVVSWQYSLTLWMDEVFSFNFMDGIR